MSILYSMFVILSLCNTYEKKDYYVCFSPNCGKNVLRFNNIDNFKSHLIKYHECKNIDKSQMKFGDYVLKVKDKFDHPFMAFNKKSFFACITPDIDVDTLIGMTLSASSGHKINMIDADRTVAVNTMAKTKQTMTLRDMTTGNTAGKKLPNVMFGGNLKYPIYGKN